MLTDQEILDAVPTNDSFDERTKMLWFGRFIETLVIARSLELINAAKEPAGQPAIDLNTNERGEPDAIYLQLHDPDDIDAAQAADYRGDGVTWCWERIHENDVRYVRADLAVKK